MSLSRLIVFMVLFLAATAVQAATIHVPSEQPTIQAGIDAAVSGDSVMIFNGRYYEHDIVVKSGVTLLSRYGSPAGVRIIANQEGRVLLFDSLDSACSVIGLTIEGGKAVYSSPGGSRGGGAYVTGAEVSFIDCIIMDNTAVAGGGVNVRSGFARLEHCIISDNATFGYEGNGGGLSAYPQVSISDCLFIRNTTSNAGGAIWANSASHITGTRFDSNEATVGGAIWFGYGDCSEPPYVRDCEFYENLSWGYGAAMNFYRSDSSLSVENSVFSGNDSRIPSAIIVLWSTNARFNGCVFERSEASDRGSIVTAREGTTSWFTNCTFAYCSTPDGSTISAQDSSSLTIHRSILALSAAGSAVYVSSEAEVTLTCCDIYGNAGGDWIGGIEAQYNTAGNISADPLFCYPSTAGRFGLMEDSPCAPGNNSCGELIGALDVACSATAIRDGADGILLPSSSSMSQNYPNPFNPTTTVRFSVLSHSQVSISIYNILGQHVRTLVNQEKPAGTYRVNWDGTDDFGRMSATGVYFYRFCAGDYVKTRKMVILK